MSENLAYSDDIYECLGVLKDSSSQTIHRNFLKLVRKALEELQADQPGSSNLHLEQLTKLWFAHDILMDPSTRTDYDLRALGITTGNFGEDNISNGQAINFNQEPDSQSLPSWRIGELMQASGLLEQAELDIACDMHKAMPEMQFGRFLVKQGFITDRQLQALLIGQVLLRLGEITLSQFCAVIAKLESSNQDFKEILLESGYVTNALLIKLEPKLKFN